MWTKQSSLELAGRMQGFSVAGIILFWAARSAQPCLSLPLPFSLKLSPGTISEGFGDQVNSSFMVTEEMEEDEDMVEREEEEMDTKLEGVQVDEGVGGVQVEEGLEGVQVEESVEGVQGVRNQQVGFHNDSHGTLVSKGW